MTALDLNHVYDSAYIILQFYFNCKVAK